MHRLILLLPCALTAVVTVLGSVLLAQPGHANPPPSQPPAKWLDDTLPWHEPADRRVAFAHLDLAVIPDLTAKTLQGTATYTLQRSDGAPPLRMDAVALTMTEVAWLDGGKAVPAQWHALDGAIAIAWPETNERHHLLRLKWTATPHQGFYFVGPDQDEPERPVHAWTQGETEEIRHWVPAPDDPDQRLSWQVAITAPKQLVALSNGDPAGKTETGALATTTFRSTPKLPLYLLAVAVGPFVAVPHPHKGIPVVTWALPGEAVNVQTAFAKLPGMIDALSAKLGVAYPFARYSQVVVHEFNFGGMENATLTILTHRNVADPRSSLDRTAEGLLAHELAHQWFGDLVTCRTWADIWLNEGWASFGDAIWHELEYGADRYAEELAGLRSCYLGEASSYQRPLIADRTPDADDLFDGHTYCKGAWTAHMLRRLLGEQPFWQAVASYLTLHRFQSVETIDLQRAMERASGLSLRGFFKRWLQQAGHPVVRAELRWDQEAKTTRVTLEQTQKVERGLPLFDLRIEVAVHAKLDEPPQIHVLHLNRQRGEWSLPTPHRPALVELDPRSAWLIDWTLQAPPEDLAALLRHSKFADVRMRALADAGQKLGSKATLDAVIHVLQHDPARHVRARAASTLGKAAREAVLAPLQIALADDKEPMVRQAAAKALGMLVAAQALPALRRAAEQDKSYETQAAALRALVAIDRPAARPLLLQALQWPSYHDAVQTAALTGLGAVAQIADWPVVVAALQPGRSKFLREGAAAAVAEFGARVESVKDEARRALEANLHDGSARIRRAAADGLAALDDARAKPALLAAAAREQLDKYGNHLRDVAKGLGGQSPLQDRLQRLEEEVQQLRQQGGKGGKGGH